MPRRISGKRYAQALFELGLEAQDLRGWGDDLRSMAKALSDEATVAILDSPSMPKEEKFRAIRAALSGLRPQIQNLACLLAARGRVELAPSVVDGYERLEEGYIGVTRAEVVTAVPLGDTDREAISQRLAALAHKEVKLEVRVDPTIIGGLVAKVGDQLLDGSTRTRLQELKRALVQAG